MPPTDKLTNKQLVDSLKAICEEEAKIVSLRHTADFIFDHYDSDIHALYVRELESSSVPVSYEMLSDLKCLTRQLNKRAVIGIIYNAYYE